MVDFGLAGNIRYLELGYDLEMLEDERLGNLREWWTRFKRLGWWHELEEMGEVHPPCLTPPKGFREV